MMRETGLGCSPISASAARGYVNTVVVASGLKLASPRIEVTAARLNQLAATPWVSGL